MAGGGGVEGLEGGGSRTESRWEAISPGLTVRIDGAGMVAVSDETVTTTGGRTVGLRFKARSAR